MKGMQEYKNLSWVWGVDRKIRPEGNCHEACRVMPDKECDHEGRILTAQYINL